MNGKRKLSLKAIRINNGWSAEETAEKYGISLDTLRNYENYKTFPDVPIIENILKTTNMKYDDIIFLPIDYGKTVEKKKNRRVEMNELEIKTNEKGYCDKFILNGVEMGKGVTKVKLIIEPFKKPQLKITMLSDNLNIECTDVEIEKNSD